MTDINPELDDGEDPTRRVLRVTEDLAKKAAEGPHYGHDHVRTDPTAPLPDDDVYVSVRAYSGGVFADGTTNTPPIDYLAPNVPAAPLPDEETGADVDARLITKGHDHRRQRSVCPGCGESLMRVGIHRIVYAFRVCDDSPRAYSPHVYEQMWHRACFRKDAPDVGW